MYPASSRCCNGLLRKTGIQVSGTISVLAGNNDAVVEFFDQLGTSVYGPVTVTATTQSNINFSFTSNTPLHEVRVTSDPLGSTYPDVMYVTAFDATAMVPGQVLDNFSITNVHVVESLYVAAPDKFYVKNVTAHATAYPAKAYVTHLSATQQFTVTRPVCNNVEDFLLMTRGYRFGFNGKENDNEIAGTGNSQDFGARMYDNRLGRWKSCDPLASKYPSISPFAFALNTPIQAYDPDGRLVIFAHGFIPWDGFGNKRSSGQGELIYNHDYNNYWAGIDYMFMRRTGDYNVRYVNGEHSATSQAPDRMEEGRIAARNLHAQILSGEVQLKRNDAGEIIETIQIVGHSQGAAYAAGMAEELVKLNYKVENVYYLAPHQPGDIEHPDGVRGVQYSHPEDRISSKAPWWLPNGGSSLAPIPGLDKANEYNVFQDPAWNMGIMGDRGGHNVGLHTYIFNNACSTAPGYVAPSSSPGSVIGSPNPGAQEVQLSGGSNNYLWGQ